MKEINSLLAENELLFENNRQATIYTCLLNYGELGAEQLRQKTGLHRETIQRELTKMTKKGTVVFHSTGRNKKAKAVSVSQLQEILELKMVSFEKLLKPLLEAESNKKLPKIEVVTGNHSYGLLEMKLLRQMPAGETLCTISNQGSKWREAMVESKKLSQFEKLRIKKELKLHLSCFEESRGEVEYNNREYFAGQPTELKRKYRYIQTEETSPLMIQIWFNHVVISSFLSTPSIHIVIEDANMKKAMLAYFKVLWNLSSI